LGTDRPGVEGRPGLGTSNVTRTTWTRSRAIRPRHWPICTCPSRPLTESCVMVKMRSST
jgi:hypothetical protein